MTENHIAHVCALAPEAAANEPASSFNPYPASAGRPLPSRNPHEFTFDNQGEEDAYWAGVVDGMRNSGDDPSPRLAARARDHYPELVATAEEIRNRGFIDFDAVSVRHRIDGWTPEKQREYVEALADSGVARYAAARVGMSEQSASRLRRRADARSFDRACDLAMRHGARRLVSVAFERAIEGSVRKHYYHGEVVGEERVYDNRLLMSLIAKLGPLVLPAETDSAADQWQPLVEAVEQGLPEPFAAAPEGDESGMEEDEDGSGEDMHLWEDEDLWWTDFPPPPDYDGLEQGKYGDDDYHRTLSTAELAVIRREEAEELAERRAEAAEERDRYFGFSPNALEGGAEGPQRLADEEALFIPKGPELYETFAEPPESRAAGGAGGAQAGFGDGEGRPAGRHQPNPSDGAA